MTNPLNYQRPDSAICYQPPARIHPARIAFGLLSSALFAAIGATAYALILPNLTYFVLRIVAVLAAGGCTGLLCRTAVRYAKIRRPAVAATLGAILSLFTLYVMWVVWMYDSFRRAGVIVPLRRLALEPRTLFQMMRFVNQLGTWRYGDKLIQGGDLLVLWIGEAAIILGGGVLIAWKAPAEDDPICRACGQTCVRVPDLPRFSALRQADFVAAIESRDFTYLPSHPAPTSEIDPELALRLMGCRACHETNVLTVRHVAWYRNSQTGRRSVQSEVLIDGLLLTPAEMADLVTTCLQIVEQRAAPDANRPAADAS